MYITEEMRDAQLSQMMSTFLNSAQSNQSELGLTTAQISQLTNAFAAFATDLQKSSEAKALLASAVYQKNASKDFARNLIVQYAQEWRANGAISDSTLAALMVAPHATVGTRTPPTTPINPTLNATPQGLITLRWNRNGNRPTTVFAVEVANSPDGPYTLLDVTTKTKMNIRGVPGTPIWFRIAAKRNGQTSGYSLPISLWANGTSERTLKMSA